MTRVLKYKFGTHLLLCFIYAVFISVIPSRSDYQRENLMNGLIDRVMCKYVGLYACMSVCMCV